MRGRAAGAVVAVAIAACTPVSMPEPDQGVDADGAAPLAYDPNVRRLRAGERVPDVALVDAQGRVTTLSQMQDAVLVVTFYAADERGDEMLERIGALDAALVDRLLSTTRVIAVFLGPAPGAAEQLRADARRHSGMRGEWIFARPVDGDIAAITGAFGVAVWESGGGAVQHTFSTVVVDRDGRLVDRFSGLETWRVGDLVAAIDAAVGR